MKNEVIPFGKYKGKPVEVLQNDRQYVEWLTAQKWFREKHSHLFQVVINNFTQPVETPDHNRLQVRFLDRGFLLAFMRAFGWDPTRLAERHDTRMAKGLEEELRTFIRRNTKYDYEAGFGTQIIEIPPPQEEVARERERLGKYYFSWDSAYPSAKFEEGGFDVVIRCGDDYFQALAVECKPCVGDDYPAILRQIMNSEETTRKRVLVYESFAAEGATEEQVAEIFRRSGIACMQVEGECITRIGEDRTAHAGEVPF